MDSRSPFKDIAKSVGKNLIFYLQHQVSSHSRFNCTSHANSLGLSIDRATLMPTARIEMTVIAHAIINSIVGSENEWAESVYDRKTPE